MDYEDFNSDEIRSFSDWLYSLSAFEFSLVSSAIGFIIAPTLTTNQQNSLGNFLELIGQILLTFNAQNIMVEAEKAKSDLDINTQIANMQKDLDNLKKMADKKKF